MSIILTSVITSLVVSIIYSKWFMSNLEKWMQRFFDEEELRAKKFIDDITFEIKRKE